MDFVLPSQLTSQGTSFPCHPFLAWSLCFICGVWGGRPRLLHIFARIQVLLMLHPKSMFHKADGCPAQGSGCPVQEQGRRSVLLL